MKPERSALDASYTSNPVANGKTAAFVQATKDLVWASNTLEHDVAAACQRIGTDLGLAPNEMPPDKGPGGYASGICNAVNKRLDLIQRTQGLNTWVTIAAPKCRPNRNTWSRCGAVCNVQDPQCNLLCRVHANVHADCDRAQVRIRAGRTGALPPRVQTTLSANLPSLVHARIAIAERLAPDMTAVSQVAAMMPQAMANAGGDVKACIGAGSEATKDAARRFRISERAASDVLARVQGR
jgi:hypothetical protein